MNVSHTQISKVGRIVCCIAVVAEILEQFHTGRPWIVGNSRIEGLVNIATLPHLGARKPLILLGKIVAIHHHCLVETWVAVGKDVYVVGVIGIEYVVVREVTTICHTKHFHIFEGEESHTELIHTLYVPVTIPSVCTRTSMNFNHLLAVATEPVGGTESVAIVLLTVTGGLYKGEIVAVGAIGLEEILTSFQRFLPKFGFVAASPYLVEVLILLVASEFKIRFVTVKQRRSHEVPQPYTQTIG